MIKHSINNLLLLILFSLFFVSCDKEDYVLIDFDLPDIKDSIELNSVLSKTRDNIAVVSDYKRIWWYYNRLGRYDLLEKNAKEVISKFSSTQEYDILAFANAYVADALLFMGKYDEVKPYLESASEYGTMIKQKDCYFEELINNIAALYALKRNFDFTTAIYYLKRALSIAEKTKDTLNQSAILINIVNIHFLREDETGLNYAIRARELVKDKPAPFINTHTLLCLSKMYKLCGNFDKALQYSELSLKSLFEISDNKSINCLAYTIYANINL